MTVMDDFTGRVAVITGAASGIGLGLARTGGARGHARRDGRHRGSPSSRTPPRTSPRSASRRSRCRPTSPTPPPSRRSPMPRSSGSAVRTSSASTRVSSRPACRGSAPRPTGQWVLGVNLWGPIHGVRAFMPRLIAQRRPVTPRDHVVDGRDAHGRVLRPLRRVEVRRRRARGVRRARRARAGHRARRRVVPRARLRRHPHRLVGPQPAGRGARRRPPRPTTSSSPRRCRR